jgi:Tfp pilus assembly pilus retraction ATPase PilT
METGRADGMYTLDECLAQLLREGKISERTAKGLSKNPDVMLSRASRMRPSRFVVADPR